MKTKKNKNIQKALAVYSNTDLTEGRGSEYPMHICKTEATARRLSKGRYVMGTDCPIREVEIIIHNNLWYGPIGMVHPTKEDMLEQARIDDEKEAKRKKEAAIEKAKSLGLSDEELEALRS